MENSSVSPLAVGLYIVIGFLASGALAGLLFGHFLLGISTGAVLGALAGLNTALFVARRQRNQRRSREITD